MTDPVFDLAIVGGGVLGCSTALFSARGGMTVVVLEKDAICRGASGVNAGTFFVQSKNIQIPMMPYVMRSREMWRTTADWLGADVGFKQKGGLILAFTDAEAAELSTAMELRKAAGAPVELVGRNRARELEPGLSEHPVLASFCPLDGYANSNLLGMAFRRALLEAGVEIREHAPVGAIEKDGMVYRLETPAGPVRAKRLVLSAGVWLHELAQRVGLRIPIICRVNTVSVSERVPPFFERIIGSVTGLLTLKQSAGGSVLIGGGWQGIGDPERGGVEVVEDNLVGNFRLACWAIPGIAKTRVVRTWMGLDGQVADNLPVIGEIPGYPGAYLLGCVRAGFTIGPFVGKIFAQTLLGQQPELPILDKTFDPGRFKPAEVPA